MRPQVNITGYENAKACIYIVKKEYIEHPGATPEIEYYTFFFVYDMYKEIKRCIAEAKENTYDYRVEFETL